MAEIVRRGDIYWLDWSPGRGSEQSGLRPALVIQNDVGNQYSRTTIVAALTTAIERAYPFMVKVSAKESGLPKDSLVNLAAIVTVDKSRLVRRCGALTDAKMTAVNEAIKESLGLMP